MNLAIQSGTIALPRLDLPLRIRPAAPVSDEDLWDALSEREQERFPPLCPDFVVELRSPSDDLGELHAKMREYIENGAGLGWLIDPTSKTAWTYARDRLPIALERPGALSGEPDLPGLLVGMEPIW